MLSVIIRYIAAAMYQVALLIASGYPAGTLFTAGAPGGALLQDCQNAFSGRQQGTSRGGIPAG
jgi:hypothetical protein